MGVVLTGGTGIDFTMFSSIFTFIVDGVTELCSLFQVFPLNIALAIALVSVCVTLIKRFAPGKKTA
jgi:hypothetical protein